MLFLVLLSEDRDPPSGPDLHRGLGDIVAQAFDVRAARVVPFYFLEGGETVTALRRIVHRGDAVYRFRAQRFPTARLCADQSAYADSPLGDGAFGSTDNFPVLPRAPSLRELASRSDD